ncbi:MAG TPA: hypothetical protein VI997_07750 [Candidatus Thermoplasmatota archaeon]|nr:hypothetical protein [Candidatus Thermoplasmatota archaeon]
MPWSLFAVLGALDILAGAAMGWVVYLAGPDRTANRLLAPLLFFDGAMHVAILPWMGDPRYEPGIGAVHTVSVLAATVLYFLFVSTLETPLARPLRGPRGRLAAAAVGAGAVLVYLALPPGAPARDVVDGAKYPLFVLAVAYGFAAAWSARRRVPAASPARERATAYLIAFGARDGMYFMGLFFPWDAFLGPGEPVASFLIEAATLVFVALMVWGALRARLLDIEIKVKVGIKRSTIGAAFLVAFIVVAEVAENWLDARLGLVAGGVAAAALLLALHPLQRLAGRVADAVLPGVSASPEYMAYRKLHVYRAAAEEIVSDGTVTPKERAALDRLRRELGLAEDAAAAIEADAAAARAP